MIQKEYANSDIQKRKQKGIRQLWYLKKKITRKTPTRIIEKKGNKKEYANSDIWKKENQKEYANSDIQNPNNKKSKTQQRESKNDQSNRSYVTD